MNARTDRTAYALHPDGLDRGQGRVQGSSRIGWPQRTYVPAAGSVDSETEEVTASGLRAVPLAGDRIAICMACLTLRERT